MPISKTLLCTVFACVLCTASASASTSARALAQSATEPEIFSLEDYEANSRRGADRDAFQVLDNPKLSSVKEAEDALSPEEPVIGLRVGNVARAYPISVMGGIELVNDQIGELPVTVSW
jgi:hypothetical protein